MTQESRFGKAMGDAYILQCNFTPPHPPCSPSGRFTAARLWTKVIVFMDCAKSICTRMAAQQLVIAGDVGGTNSRLQASAAHIFSRTPPSTQDAIAALDMDRFLPLTRLLVMEFGI